MTPTQPASKSAQKLRYRKVKVGTIIRAGDQFKSRITGVWTPSQRVGQTAYSDYKYRRPLAQPKRAKKKPRPCTKAEHDLINLCNHNIGSDAKVAALRAHVAKAISGYRAARRRAGGAS